MEPRCLIAVVYCAGDDRFHIPYSNGCRRYNQAAFFLEYVLKKNAGQQRYPRKNVKS